MADVNKDSNVFSDNDPLDINELASLNEDISPEFIEQLQSQISKDAKILNGDNADEDAALFEEVDISSEQTTQDDIGKNLASGNIDNNVDDNFIKKYKARLEKQKRAKESPQERELPTPAKQEAEEPPKNIDIPVMQVQTAQQEQPTAIPPTVQEAHASTSVPASEQISIENQSFSKPTHQQAHEQKIEKVSGGNIVERPLSQEQITYSEELDKLDGNTNYSKYVIYISPENKEFIDGLTVKERKNLINKIIKEQGDISITKNKYRTVQTAIRHAIIAIITVAIAIPVTYSIINASLEASIDNYRRSQGMFQTLYKEHGKIKNID